MLSVFNVFKVYSIMSFRNVTQIVQLDDIPNGVGTEGDKDLLLKKGIEVSIPDIDGTPTTAAGEVQDPLTKKNYDITFVGIDGEEVKTRVKLGRKIWFDGTKINK